MVKKYQDAITSDLYMDLLQRGRRRVERIYPGNFAFCKYYDKKFQMIERIKKQEYDLNFEYKEPEKRIHLEIGNDGYIYRKRD